MGLSGSSTRKLVLVNEGSEAKGGGAPISDQLKQIMSELEEADKSVKEKPKQDNYWNERTKDLQKKHDDIGRVMEEEYQKAYDEMGGRQQGKTSTYVPCAADTKKIIACYKNNPLQPMLCADVFKAFEECVTRERIEATECCCE